MRLPKYVYFPVKPLAIKALNVAKTRLLDRRNNYICAAIEDSHEFTEEATLLLKSWIESMLDEHFTVMLWLRANDPVYWNSTRQDDRGNKAARLAWIDYLIQELQDELPSIHPT